MLQPVADGLKAMTKEDIVPRAADKIVHFLAPLVLVAPNWLGVTKDVVLRLTNSDDTVSIDLGGLSTPRGACTIGSRGARLAAPWSCSEFPPVVIRDPLADPRPDRAGAVVPSPSAS